MINKKDKFESTKISIPVIRKTFLIFSLAYLLSVVLYISFNIDVEITLSVFGLLPFFLILLPWKYSIRELCVDERKLNYVKSVLIGMYLSFPIEIILYFFLYFYL